MDDIRTSRLSLRDNLTGQGLVLTALAMMALGVVMVFSACIDTSESSKWYNRADSKQAVFALGALFILLTLWKFDYHSLLRPVLAGQWRYSFLLSPGFAVLAMGFGLSVLVLFAGHASHGQARWLKIGPLHIQPSEILKIGLIISLAAYLSRQDIDRRSFLKCFLPIMLVVGASAALVAKQNVSSAAIIVLGAAAVMIMGGVPWYYLLGTVPFAAVGGWYYISKEQYRLDRILAFVNPWDGSMKATYQPMQSLLAIASGGYEPAGLGGGVAKYGYLPETDNDFIFSFICEEAGLAGVLLVVGLLFLWLLLTRRAVKRSPDQLGAMLAGGIGFLLVLQGVLHIAVCAVAVPPTGVSLPFVSAGGSSLLTMAVAVAIMISVTSRQPVPESQLRPTWHAEAKPA